MPVKDSTLDSGGGFARLRFVELILRSLPTWSALVDDGALNLGGGLHFRFHRLISCFLLGESVLEKDRRLDFADVLCAFVFLNLIRCFPTGWTEVCRAKSDAYGEDESRKKLSVNT